MSRRLTNQLRGEIVDACVTHSLAKRKDKINKKLDALGAKAYRALVSSQMEKKMKSMPKGYFSTRSSLQIFITMVKSKEKVEKYIFISERMKTRWSNDYCYLDINTSKLFPAFVTGSCSINSSHSTAQAIMDIDKEFLQLEKVEEKLRQQIREMVYAFTTVERLIEHWPQGKRFIPEAPTKMAALIPSTDKVNALINDVRA